MEVILSRTARPGCVPTLFSLGLARVLLSRQINGYPKQLNDTAMVLRNGKVVPWASITRFRVTEIIWANVSKHKQYEMWHPGGKVWFPSSHVENTAAVIDFIIAHLPRGIPTS